MSDVTTIPGVGLTAEKLTSAGYHDMLSIAVASIGSLVEAIGVSESVARKMIQYARDNLNMGFESGMDVMKKRELVTKISTGSENFNALLEGGFETGAIVNVLANSVLGKRRLATYWQLK